MEGIGSLGRPERDAFECDDSEQQPCLNGHTSMPEEKDLLRKMIKTTHKTWTKQASGTWPLTDSWTRTSYA